MKSLFLLLALTALFLFHQRAAAGEIDPERIAEIAKMLPEKPEGLGPTISNRTAWQSLTKIPAFQNEIKTAKKLLKTPLPQISDDLYLDFFKTGNRKRFETVSVKRQKRISILTIAECLENKGRFIPELTKTLRSVCAEKTWVLPAHDKNKENFLGKNVTIDLVSSNVAWNLALTLHLLEDKLDKDTRQLVKQRIEHFIFTPYMDVLHEKRPPFRWMPWTNNWNAVCLAHITGAALAIMESREQRAEIVASAEFYSQNFLNGFPSDGYCTEGLAYWNYGFGRYILLCDTLWQATSGRLDLMANENAQRPALLGARSEIIGGIYPAFADCYVDAKPDSRIMWYVSKRLGLNLEVWEKQSPAAPTSQVFETLIYSFPNAATDAPPFPPKKLDLGKRTWFDQSGVLICRPDPKHAASGKTKFGVALKGGNNSEHHNHNDVGSYIVASGKQILLADPGLEVYTERTFSSKRYESNVINSRGHPVPVIGGRLQKTGETARAENIKTDFTDVADTYSMEIASCYDVPELQSLVRTFVYSRKNGGSLSVTDVCQLKAPEAFETALITFGSWKKIDSNNILVQENGEAVKVEINTPGNSFDITEEIIDEDVRYKKKPLRLGIRLKEKSKKHTVTIRIAPRKR